MKSKRGMTVVEVLVVVAIIMIIMAIVIPSIARQRAKIENYTIELPASAAGAPTESGKDVVALFFCLDVSPSMDASIGDQRKLDISIKALEKSIDQMTAYAKAHPEKKVKAGLCTFDSDAAIACPLAPLDKARMMAAARSAKVGGGTAVGKGLLAALPSLIATPCETRAVIMLTDGQSNTGVAPESVVEAVKANRNDKKVDTADIDVYLIAFDVASSYFDDVKKAGATVVESRDRKSLEEAMNSMVEQVLLEAP